MDNFYDKERAGEHMAHTQDLTYSIFEINVAKVLDEIVAERMHTSQSPQMYSMDTVSLEILRKLKPFTFCRIRWQSLG